MSEFLKIPTLLVLTTKNNITFDIYLKQPNHYILYATPENFTEESRQKLHDIGKSHLYISNNDKKTYEQYIEENLIYLLEDTNIPTYQKQEILYQNSMNIVDNLFTKSNDEHLEKESYIQIHNMVNNIYDFIIDKHNGLKNLQNLIKASYKEYVHAVNVSVYAMSLLIHHNKLNSMRNIKNNEIKRIGISAILHDIGKANVPSEILNKRGELTKTELEEVKKHPIYSFEKCQFMNLNSDITNSILFHHEKLDGSGYPSGTKNIKENTQIITICDMYDAMLSERPFRTFVHTPFKALRKLQMNVLSGKLDAKLVSSFISLISTNQFIAGNLNVN